MFTLFTSILPDVRCYDKLSFAYFCFRSWTLKQLNREKMSRTVWRFWQNCVTLTWLLFWMIILLWDIDMYYSHYTSRRFSSAVFWCLIKLRWRKITTRRYQKAGQHQFGIALCTYCNFFVVRCWFQHILKALICIDKLYLLYLIEIAKFSQGSCRVQNKNEKYG